jgi:phospholipase/carboxylesterase
VAYTWGPEGQDDPVVEEYVFRAIEQTRRHLHVHSERIYLAGFREGAMLAYRLGLLFPERFAGMISLNGAMPRHGGPLLRLPDVRKLRVLIGHGLANSVVPLSMAKQDYRLFYTAGMQVRMHTYAANHRIHPHMLRDIDRWVQEHIHEENESLRD